MEKLEKVNYLDISNVELTKLVRQELNLSLSSALKIARILKHVFKLGYIRGRTVTNKE